MGVTLKISSDVVGGVSGLLLAAASYAISSFAYPRLMGKSARKAVESGINIEASHRSINSVRNWLGFWTISLSTLAHFVAFCLEFGILGFTQSVVDERPAVILGGGRRFSSNVTADGGLFVDSSRHLPAVFTAAVGGCATVQADGNDDFKMIKNEYPVIDMSQNSSGTYVSEFDTFECTSSWLGSAVWTIGSSADMIIGLETVTEQYRYEDDVTWSHENGGIAGLTTDLVTISYGFGTSFRGEVLPVVVLNVSGFSLSGISISEESGHYVYSLSRELDHSSIDGAAVLNGTYIQGHYRSSEYSLGGVVCLALTMYVSNVEDSLSGMYTISDSWWESESRDGDYLIHSSPEGSEQSWPSLPDASGAVYTEYAQGTEQVRYGAHTISVQDRGERSDDSEFLVSCLGCNPSCDCCHAYRGISMLGEDHGWLLDVRRAVAHGE